ncbi:MAG: hypothetical protein WD267_00415 [Balneolales bacterium]
MNNLKRIELLKGFLANDPENSFTIFALALEHVNISEYKIALGLFEDLQKSDPDYVGLYYHLGKLYETLDEEKLAIATYKKGLDVAQKEKDPLVIRELQDALAEHEPE